MPLSFARLSEQSQIAHNSLYLGIEWTELVSTFLDDPLNRKGWVERNSLARLNLEERNADVGQALQ